MNNIENYLRDNKPVVKDDPTFLLETMRRMDAVEGIKAEVDHQRRHGRTAIVVTLAAGLVLGVFVTVIAFLYPVDPASAGEGIWESLRVFLESWKQYLVFPVAALTLALSLVLSKGSSRQLL